MYAVCFPDSYLPGWLQLAIEGKMDFRFKVGSPYLGNISLVSGRLAAFPRPQNEMISGAKIGQKSHTIPEACLPAACSRAILLGPGKLEILMPY